MLKIIIHGQNYEIIEDYKNGYQEEIIEKITDYFDPFDYIAVDWAYGKPRLKGFCDKNNLRYKKENDIETLKEYLKNQCAYDCRYCVLKKLDS